MEDRKRTLQEIQGVVCEVNLNGIHWSPLPPFDATIERICRPRYNTITSEQVSNGVFEVVRESVSIEEVLEDIEKALEDSE